MEQQKAVQSFFETSVFGSDMGGVLGREAPQNTFHINFRTHEGSKMVETLFVFSNPTVSTHFWFLIIILKLQTLTDFLSWILQNRDVKES